MKILRAVCVIKQGSVREGDVLSDGRQGGEAWSIGRESGVVWCGMK
jgi:hypothetical protein